MRAAGLGAVLLAACASGRPAAPPPEPAKAAVVAPTPPPAKAAPAPAAAPVASPPPQAMAGDDAEILVGTACLTCHTRELIEGSHLGFPGWKAEITKMKKWGAPVPDEDEGPLAAWLAQKYGPATADVLPASVEPAVALAQVKAERRAVHGSARRGEAAWAQACAKCHGAKAEGTGGGPTLLDAPVLRRPGEFAAVVREGRGRMPGFGDVRAGDVLAWLRAQQLSAAASAPR